MTPSPLVACWRKKTVSVTEKLVLLAAYVIDTLAVVALAIYGSLKLWDVVGSPLINAVNSIISVFANIPWYYYAGAIAILTVPVYSFLWCVNKELTEEDRDQSPHPFICGALLILVLVACLLYQYRANLLYDTDVGLYILHGIIIPLAIGVIGGIIVIQELPFLSACWHYLKRTRGNR